MANPRSLSAIVTTCAFVYVLSGLGLRYFRIFFVLLGLVYFGDGLYVDAHPQAPGGFLQCVPLFRLVSDLAAHPHALSWQLSVRPFVWFDWYPGRKTISRLQLNSVRPLLCFDWSLHIGRLPRSPSQAHFTASVLKALA